MAPPQRFAEEGGASAAPWLVCGLRPIVLLCVLIVSSMSFNLGYDIGVMSGAKRLIAADLSLTSWEVSMLVGSLNLISGLGGLWSGFLADSIGRRATAALSSAVCTAAVLLMAAAPSFGLLMAGRVLDGLGIGSAFQIAPLYIAEMAPRRLRGRLCALSDLFINAGILSGYLVGWVLSGVPRAGVAWRVMVGIGALPSALVLCSIPYLPESPRYLVASGRVAQADAVLSRAYDDEEAAATLAMLRDEVGGGRARGDTWRALRSLCTESRGHRALVGVAMALAVAQQITGVEAAVYYTPETLEAAGVRDDTTLHLATVGVGFLKTAVIGIVAPLVDRYGRVPLLLASNLGIATAQALIGVSFAAGGVTWAALVGQLLFMASFSLGAGPCTMMLVSELLPLSVRGVGLGVATLLNRLASGTVATSFLSLNKALTPAGTFFAFSAAALAAAACTAFVPETRGRALEEIAHARRGSASLLRARTVAASPCSALAVRSASLADVAL